jgi:hypothetical protein
MRDECQSENDDANEEVEGSNSNENEDEEKDSTDRAFHEYSFVTSNGTTLQPIS